MHKRRFYKILALLLLLISIFSGCNNEQLYVFEDTLAVDFLSVGQGDCIFISFPDGKTMLIDCAQKDEKVADKIVNHIKHRGNKIDYFLLTHSDLDHIGNAEYILDNIKVENALIPYIKNLDLFPIYKEIYNILIEKEVHLIYSTCDFYLESDYFMSILSPFSLDGKFYNEFNAEESPSDQQINDTSAVLYLSYAGKRLLFTGDAGENVENQILSDYKSGVYNKYFNGEKINLDLIDVLKVSHHGSSSSSTKEFLNILRPTYAVIKVGAGNIYNHPSTETLKRIVASNINVEFLRTDFHGDVSIKIQKNGILSIDTELKGGLFRYG